MRACVKEKRRCSSLLRVGFQIDSKTEHRLVFGLEQILFALYFDYHEKSASYGAVNVI